jgi:eukaryotic-like serine/threonine-protein kinase
MARECTSCHRTFQDKLSHCPYDGAPLVRSSEPVEDEYLGLELDGKVRLDQKLGEGGMCDIYKATIIASNQPCAVKILHKNLIEDKASIKRFKNEVRTASMLKHPNIVNLIDSGETSDGIIYMVMELLNGVTLKQMLHHHGPFSVERMNNIVKQICDALTTAHAIGIIHRDLKPDNIMLLKLGSDQREIVKILDFGIAKIFNKNSVTGEFLPSDIVMGTPRYMSPEQCQGNPIDARSDIYSLGLIVYEMLSGVPPFTDSSARVLMNKHTQEPVPSLKRRRPSLSSIVERAIMRALEKSPLKRPQTALEFAEEIDMAVHTDPSISPEHHNRFQW